MPFIRKHWLLILIAIAVVIIVVAIFRPSPNLELKRQFKKEREQIIADLERSKAREKLLRLDSISIRKRMKQRADSVETLLAAKDKAITKIKKQNVQIDFSRFTDRDLDSARKAILSRHFLRGSLRD